MARQDFIDQLEALGYKVEERGDFRLAFRYIVPIGRFEGKEILLGFIVTDDFPLNPPSGPHLWPQICCALTSKKISALPSGTLAVGEIELQHCYTP